jgi:hypothetical protein
MRCAFVDAGAVGGLANVFPDDFGVMPSPHTRPILLIARKTRPPVMPADAVHSSIMAF